ncbi:glycoside hydrolase family 43 protein [Buttiauxella sp. S19-1]|uniref:glycoside hydrolase family 43 protein n=1 Tax=Buttiauxella sp. S19-1 TaxID=941430 RepID=UPI001EDB4B91|nr:glycoside hydrolase family 43 protein [Buttiauxella sp. S19-1]
MYNITNPILKGFNPDPSLCRQGEDYYIATSTFEWFPGVRIYHSRDLKHWSLVSCPLDRVSMLDMKGNPDSGGIWAPCLSYADGQFWLLYTDVKIVDSPWKNGRNYLVTAPSVEGPWSEPVAMGNGGFDPSLFHDTDGRKYYVYRPWGPRHHSNPHNTIVLQEYFPEQKKLSSERKTLFTGTPLGYTEGAHIYQKEGYYYLMVAEGGTSYEHAVVVLRSTTLDGPWELHPETTVMTSWHLPENPLQKSGHGSLLETHTGEWYMAYLTSRPQRLPGIPLLAAGGRGYCSLGRETGITGLEWRDGWPYVKGGKHAAQTVAGPQMQESTPTDDENWFEDFNGESLNPELQTLRIPFDENLGSLTERRGFLRLYGNDSLNSRFTQSTVARRWQHFVFQAETRMQFSPAHFQQSAGMTCYYNTKNWSYCFMDWEEGRGRTLKIIQLDRNVPAWPLHDEPIQVPDNVESVWLRVNVDRLSYYYSYSFDGKNWQTIPLTFEAWKLSDDYIAGRGFFTGAFVGLHCEDISGDGCHADFDYFSYQPAAES